MLHPRVENRQQRPHARNQGNLLGLPGGAQAGVVADPAGLHRHVEVLADEDALAGQVQAGHGEHRHQPPARIIRVQAAGRDRPSSDCLIGEKQWQRYMDGRFPN